MRKKLLSAICVLLVCSFISVSIVYPGLNGSSSTSEKTLVLTKDDLVNSGTTELTLVFNIGGAEVNIVQSPDESIIVSAVVTYDDEKIEPVLTKIISDDKFIAAFTSRSTKTHCPPSTVHEWDITIGSYDTDTQLVIDFGGVTADIDLGGVPMTKLVLNLGRANVDLDFSSPTIRSTTNAVVNCVGADLSMLNIGNIDFDKFVMNAGGGSSGLDFHGAYSEGTHDIVISLGGGILQTTLPIEVGEYLHVFSAAGGVAVEGEGWENLVLLPWYKEYITDDYSFQDTKLDLKVIAAGSGIIVERN